MSKLYSISYHIHIHMFAVLNLVTIRNSYECVHISIKQPQYNASSLTYFSLPFYLLFVRCVNQPCIDECSKLIAIANSYFLLGR